MTGEVLAILGIGITAISVTTALLMQINASVLKMSTKMETKLDRIEFRLQEQNGKIDRLPK